MNQSSERLSPGRVDDLVVPLHQPVRVGEGAALSRRPASPASGTLRCLMSSRPQLAVAAPGCPAYQNEAVSVSVDVAHDQPVEIRRARAATMPRIVPADRRVLADARTGRGSCRRAIASVIGSCEWSPTMLRQPLDSPSHCPACARSPYQALQQADRVLRESCATSRSAWFRS